MISETGFVAQSLADVRIPKMFRARQSFPRQSIDPASMPSRIADLLSSEAIASSITPGARIAVAAGSRGIRNIDIMVKAVVDFVRSRGAHPFIFPAMGSHGGATAAGQLDVLERLGISERSMGCPVLSSMEVVRIGTTAHGKPVCMDKNAWESDGVVVPCRVKPHTTFRGPVESGICKMMTVGMGKQSGASVIHSCGVERMSETIVEMAQVVLSTGKVLFALPCIENAYDETLHIEAVLPKDILRREPELLKIAFDNMPRLIVGSADVLVVDEIGKEFGGTGADPNVTGHFPTPLTSGGAHVERLAFLNLSEATHGNAMGCGLADAITRKLFDAIDFDATYANCLTSKVLASARMPCILPTERQAIQFCIKTLTGEVDPPRARIVRIANTLDIATIMLSESYYEEVRQGAYEGLEAIDDSRDLAWGPAGNLITPLGIAQK